MDNRKPTGQDFLPESFRQISNDNDREGDGSIEAGLNGDMKLKPPVFPMDDVISQRYFPPESNHPEAKIEWLLHVADGRMRTFFENRIIQERSDAPCQIEIRRTLEMVLKSFDDLRSLVSIRRMGIGPRTKIFEAETALIQLQKVNCPQHVDALVQKIQELRQPFQESGAKQGWASPIVNSAALRKNDKMEEHLSLWMGGDSAPSLFHWVQQMIGVLRNGSSGETFPRVYQKISEEDFREMQDPARRSEIVQAIQRCFRDPKNQSNIQSGMELVDRFCDSSHYERIHTSKEKPHNFDQPGDPNHGARIFVEKILSGEGLLRKDEKLVILEGGPGSAANDAVHMIRELTPHEILRGYKGIDISPTAVRLARKRIQEVLSENQLSAHFNATVDVGSFPQVLESIAMTLKREPHLVLADPVRLAILSNSTLHYFWEEQFRRIMENIKFITKITRGYLILALKTPNSSTWVDHKTLRLKRNSGGYHVRLEADEGMKRVFMEPKLVREIVTGGENALKLVYFEVVKMPDYDFKERTEEMVILVAA